MTKLQTAILKTLTYADIFNYPLTLTELNYWLIQAQASVTHIDLKITPSVSKLKKYYHLKNRQSIVSLRQKRRHFSLLKFKKAKKIVKFLRLIPTIKMIAVTGALAMRNSSQADDIDLFIITRTNRLWLTRLLVNSFLSLLNLRRHPHQTNVKDKFCINLFLDESALSIHSSKRNLYTAHEILQIKVLYHKDQTYQKFLNTNDWVKKFLPNAFPDLPAIFPPRLTSSKPGLLETLAYKLQHLYMKPRLTSEKVTPHSAFFHPRPTGQIVIKQYKNKLKALKLTP